MLAFVADEEAGGEFGARWLVDNQLELFEAISEVGGFSLTVREDLRRLWATGRPGHGSMVHEDNAVTRLCEALTKLGRHQFPITMTKTCGSS